jgi:hypothetical protein
MRHGVAVRRRETADAGRFDEGALARVHTRFTP